MKFKLPAEQGSLIHWKLKNGKALRAVPVVIRHSMTGGSVSKECTTYAYKWERTLPPGKRLNSYITRRTVRRLKASVTRSIRIRFTPHLSLPGVVRLSSIASPGTQWDHPGWPWLRPTEFISLNVTRDYRYRKLFWELGTKPSGKT